MHIQLMVNSHHIDGKFTHDHLRFYHNTNSQYVIFSQCLLYFGFHVIFTLFPFDILDFFQICRYFIIICSLVDRRNCADCAWHPYLAQTEGREEGGRATHAPPSPPPPRGEGGREERRQKRSRSINILVCLMDSCDCVSVFASPPPPRGEGGRGSGEG
jgi:hypothetical protein